jgi:NADH-quinone oxidoreductase subunit J
MNGEMIAFILLSATAILGGILMLNLKKVIHMILAVVLTFVSLAGLYIMLSAEFVAVVQILIYSGAISIILIFGIMLTKHNDRQEKVKNRWQAFAVGIGTIIFFIIVYRAIRHLYFGEAETLHEGNVEQIGTELFSKYVIPFELVSVVLLVSLVGAIILAKNKEADDQ